MMRVPAFLTAVSLLSIPAVQAEQSLQTRFTTVRVDDRGFITSLVSKQTGKEYCPKGRPSALLSLHESGAPNDMLVQPVSATFRPDQQEAVLKFANGAVATIQIAAKDLYFRFQLKSLSQRGTVDNVVWGPLNTTISGKIGDILGVVREADFAIGMIGLEDNTIAGPVVDADCYSMGYYIHSPDPVKYPLPPEYKEGQWFNIGGDGVNDVAFYSHPEEYFQQVFGTGAKLEPEFGSTVAYHARDRRKPYQYFYSLLPGFKNTRPRHFMTDPVEGVDFIGSAVALYACPDDLALPLLEKMFRDEKLPFVTDADGKWIRNLTAIRPVLHWNGPVDKAIEYAKAMGFRDISRDTVEFYPSLTNKWVGHVPLAGGKSMTYKEFGEQCHKNGLTHGGLHTLTIFLKGGVCNDVTPVPSVNLQTTCRTKLAKDISPTDTDIVVTDPSLLAERGTWHQGDNSNYLRIGGEMLRYEGISESAPWTLRGVKRGHASTATSHKAGEELVKLMQDCYNGFVPDMKLMLDYADYYADLMARNGMDSIGFDGYESLVYQGHGYYAFKVFNRRLFDSYHKLTGKYPQITGSNVFGGCWEYMNACNVGGGGNMFNPANGKWAIEGKDIRNGFGHSYFPPTFGGQTWHKDLLEAETFMSMAIAWDGTFALNVDQATIDATPDKDAIFKAFNAWQDARGRGLFTKAQKEMMKDPSFKYHLERVGQSAFTLHKVINLQKGYDSVPNATAIPVTNAGPAQPLQFKVQPDVVSNGADITLPDGSVIKCDRKIERLQFIVCKGGQAWLADANQNKIADLSLTRPPTLPKGESKITVKLRMDDPAANIRFGFWFSSLDAGEKVGK